MSREYSDPNDEVAIKNLIRGMLDSKELFCIDKTHSEDWEISDANNLLGYVSNQIKGGMKEGLTYKLKAPKIKVWQWLGKDYNGDYQLTALRYATDPWCSQMVTAEPYLPSEEEREVE